MTQPEGGPLTNAEPGRGASSPAAVATATPPTPPAPPEAPLRPPWYRDLRFAIGIFAAPFFFFAPTIINLVAPNLTPTEAQHPIDAMQFISGAILLFPLAAVIEADTKDYEHN